MAEFADESKTEVLPLAAEYDADADTSCTCERLAAAQTIQTKVVSLWDIALNFGHGFCSQVQRMQLLLPESALAVNEATAKQVSCQVVGRVSSQVPGEKSRKPEP